jgi:ketosteroid isomerase-like protein
MPGGESGDLERLKELYADWGRGDFSRTDLMHPEVEARPHGEWPEGRRPSRGIERMSAEIRTFLAAWERPFRLDAEEFIQEGDRILVLIRWHGRGKGSGVEMEAEGAHLWTFRDGVAVRFETYRDREEARADLRTG